MIELLQNKGALSWHDYSYHLDVVVHMLEWQHDSQGPQHLLAATCRTVQMNPNVGFELHNKSSKEFNIEKVEGKQVMQVLYTATKLSFQYLLISWWKVAGFLPNKRNVFIISLRVAMQSCI